MIYTAKNDDDQIETNNVNVYSLDVHETYDNIYFYFYERVRLEQYYHSCSGIGVNSSAACTADTRIRRIYNNTQRDSRERSCADEL